MKPVVPKIRVGDVLHGTKNLRNYLRTCSLLQYLRELAGVDPFVGKAEASEIIYTPRKNDQFVVGANANGRFLVWEPNKQIVLFFYNGHRTAGDPEPPKSMDAQTFAKWFTRTEARYPDVTLWPTWAYYLWAAIQLNACRNQEISLPFHYRPGSGSAPFLAPFIIRHCLPNGINSATIKHAVHESIRQGTFRNEGRARARIFKGLHHGPTLEDVRVMRDEIRRLASDPRVLSRTKKGSALKEKDLEFLESVKQNPL